MYKICFFSAQYLPHMGGVENYTYNIAKELIKKGNEVTVITSHVKGLKLYEISDDIEIYRLPSINLMDGRLPILKMSYRKQEVIKEIKNKNFDIIVINTRFYFLSLFGARFAYKNNIPSIMIEHGTSHLQFSNTVLKIMENIYEHTITFFDKLYIKDFYGVSYACNDWLKHFHIKAKGVIYNSIDPSIIKNHNINSTRLKDKYLLSDNIIKFCFVGRLIKEKGIDELILAFSKLKEKYHNICLFVAGEGPLEDNVINLENKQIYFLGKLTKDKVIDLLLESDVFCLPSISEGFSTAVLEAALCKSYIITTKQGGSKELIKDDSYGSIIDNNNVKLLFIEMEKVIQKKINVKQCTKKSYNEVVTNYTWEKSAKQLIQAIEKVK